MTQICATITNLHDIKQAIDDGAEAFEFRIDYLKELLSKDNLEKEDFSFLNQKGLVIVTCRNINTEKKRKIFQMALDSGANYVDIEDDSELLGEFKGKTICSHHNFNGTPTNSEIVSIMRRLHYQGIPKAAFMVHEAIDLKNIVEASKILKKEMDKFILIGMGIPGEITRICANRLGSFITYCSVDKDKSTAPGQLTVKEAVKLGKSPIITGIIGWPLKHTYSPAIQNAAFDSVKLAGRYVRIPVLPEHLNLVPELISNYNISGLNVTIPHKEAIIPYLMEKSEAVEKIGAANTITKNLSGENTDIIGIAATLDNFVKENSKILLIGAGGAARAVAWYARKYHLTITNRSEEKAKKLADEFGGTYLPIEKIHENFDIIINATPVDPPKIPISPSTIIMDLRYPFPHYLENIDAFKTFSGDVMLLNQGEASFYLWTGKKPDMNKMKLAFSGAKDD